MNLFESDEIALTVPEAEELVSRHSQHRAEMETRAESVSKFTRDGRSLIEDGHSMSEEVKLVIVFCI